MGLCSSGHNGWNRCRGSATVLGHWPNFTTVPMGCVTDDQSEEVVVISVGASGTQRIHYLATWNGLEWRESDSENALPNVVAWRYLSVPAWLEPPEDESTPCECHTWRTGHHEDCPKGKGGAKHKCCVHCGSPGQSVTEVADNADREHVFIQCSHCGARGAEATNEANAWVYWEQRASESS